MNEDTRRWQDLPAFTSGARSLSWWGMLHVVATEGMLFTFFLFSYFFIRANHQEWPPGGIQEPELRLVLIMTVLLLSSSVPMHWAERSIKAGHALRLRIGLAAAFVLAAAFLALQLAVEYPQKEFTPRTNVYGSLFFGITAFHGLHVFVGLILNAVIQLWAWRGWFSSERHAAVENVALYWHFVDVVWIAILFSLYLSPRLL